MSLIRGVGIDDSEYKTTKYEYRNGAGKRVWICPVYMRWIGMLDRCYSKNIRPCYAGCSVSEEWLTFSNFRKWMLTQDWEGKELDKDLLISGNKVYSPHTCLFISGRLNTVIAGLGKTVGKRMKGTWYDSERDKYQASGRTYPSGKKIHIGRYNTEILAHLAWKEHKVGVLRKIILDQDDARVVQALKRIIGELNDTIHYI